MMPWSAAFGRASPARACPDPAFRLNGKEPDAMGFDVDEVRAHYPALADGYAYLDGGSWHPASRPGDRRDGRGAGRRAGELRRRVPGQPALGRDHRGVPRGRGGPHRRRARGRHPRPQHDHAHLPAGSHARGRLGTRRRDRRHPARSRRERPALGAGRRQRRGRRALGRRAASRGRPARGPVRRADLRPDQAGRGLGGEQPDRYQARRGGHHRAGARGGGTQLRGRRARHAARAGRRARAGGRLLRHERLQVVRAARGRGGRGPGAARLPGPGQADTGAR